MYDNYILPVTNKQINIMDFQLTNQPYNNIKNTHNIDNIYDFDKNHCESDKHNGSYYIFYLFFT
jgi:hypothetical protein